MKNVDTQAVKTESSSPCKDALAGAGEQSAFSRAYGALKGKVHISDDFDAALPTEVLRQFGLD